jgi:CBS domain-containing protein
MIISDILKEKRQKVFTIDSTAPVSTAVGTMRDKGLGAVVVSSNGEGVDGLLTRRKLIQAYRRASVEEVNLLQVSALMTRRMMTCETDEPLRRVMNRMNSRGTDYTIVIGDGGPVAVLSLGDIIDYRLREAERDAEAVGRTQILVC